MSLVLCRFASFLHLPASVAVKLPKLDVTGSIPVSRSILPSLLGWRFRLMSFHRWLKSSPLISVAVVFCLTQISLAQDSSNPSWSATSQQSDPDGRVNPTRTAETHTEVNGRVVDKTSIQTLGPDGRYVPYSETEKESVRVNDTTVRTIERNFAPGANGERTLILEKQEESHSLPGGEQKIVRTTSSPDANRALQVVRRELEDTKLSPGVRETHTTVLTPDVNGGLTPAVQIDQRETKASDGTIETRKSTLLSDGSGRWQLSEVRESTSKQETGRPRSKDERVLRPNANGTLAVVERTVTRQIENGPGEIHNTTETYSTNVPGQAGTIPCNLSSARASFAAPLPRGRRAPLGKFSRQTPAIPATVCASPRKQSISCDRARAARSTRPKRSSPRIPTAICIKSGLTLARPAILQQSRSIPAHPQSQSKLLAGELISSGAPQRHQDPVNECDHD